jgi:hypothetical protein
MRRRSASLSAPSHRQHVSHQHSLPYRNRQCRSTHCKGWCAPSSLLLLLLLLPLLPAMTRNQWGC